ncbi:MAG: hypothetical protein IIC36_13745, partial [Gemmatimonadetes bacterium]|nr:hypothetical protein [Gemmatimonadota bacterium]
VIYQDNAGAPGAWVATAQPVAVTGTLQWYASAFSSPVPLSAGTYWLVVHHGSKIDLYGDAGTANQRAYNADTYSDGPTDPFGAATQDAVKLGIYITYTLNSAPTVAAAIADTTVVENSPPVVNYRDLETVFTDVEEGSGLTFTIQSNTNSGLVTPTIIAADSTLDLSFTASTTGSATITIRATDGGGLFVDDVFTVTVNAAATLVARYWIDEVPSGQAPTQLIDDQASPLNLPITYDGANPTYTVASTGRGWESTTTANGGRASILVDGTKLQTTLDGATATTIELVLRVDAVATTNSRLFHIGSGSESGDLTLSSPNASTLYFYMSGENIRGQWDPGFDGTRAVYHLVYNSTESVAGNRVRLYKNGVLVTKTGGTDPPLNQTISIPNGQYFAIANRETCCRSFDGDIYYAAIYDGALTAGEVSTNYTALLANDDNNTYAVSVTPKGLGGSPVVRQVGTGYSQDFTVTNNSDAIEDFDLLARLGPSAGSFLTIDSITGTGVTQGALPDSARITGMAISGASTVTAWYTVANSSDGRVDTLFVNARSISNTAVSDEGWAEVEFDVVTATLLGRYWFNEAPSGQVPATVLDDQASPVNLAVTYDTLAWRLDAGHRGLGVPVAGRTSNLQHAGIASAPVEGTKYKTNLNGATAVTFVVVAEWEAGFSDRMAGFTRPDGSRVLLLLTNASGVLEFRYDGTLSNPRFSWPGPWDDGVRRVFHLVYDADDATEDDRVRLYVDGIDQGTPNVISGAMPPNGDGLDFSPTDIQLVALNEPDFSNGFPGSVFYLAVHEGEMTDAEITSDVAALLADDDNVTYAVSVTTDGVDTLKVLPSNGTPYSYRLSITNGSSVIDDFDLLGFPGDVATFLTVDSILGPSVTQGATPDSALIVGVPASTADSAFVWYSVADVAAGTLDSLYLEARSISSSVVSDSGWVFIEVVKPNLTTGKAVSPTGTQVPGTELTYTLTITNDGTDDATSVVVVDSIAVELDFKVGSVVNNLPSGVTATVEYSNDGAGTWTYTPVSLGCGAPANFDSCVTHVRWTLDNDLSYIGPDNTGNVEFVARIK